MNFIKISARASMSFLTVMAMSAVSLATPGILVGTYRGNVKLSGMTPRSAILHVRQVSLAPKQCSMIATLGVADENGAFGTKLRYYFDHFFPGSDQASGSFLTQTPAPSAGVGNQMVSLGVHVSGNGHLLADLTSNVLLPDGDLLESTFEMDRSAASPVSNC